MTTCKHKWQNTDQRANIWTCQYCDALYTTRSNIPPNNHIKQDDDDIQDYVSRSDLYVSRSQRNKVLEEVAKEFESMRIAFGDTAASFAVFVRNMKK